MNRQAISSLRPLPILMKYGNVGNNHCGIHVSSNGSKQHLRRGSYIGIQSIEFIYYLTKQIIKLTQIA